MKRVPAGWAGIVAVWIGIWLGGTSLDGILRDFTPIFCFALNGCLSLYLIHRRSQGYSRLAS